MSSHDHTMLDKVKDRVAKLLRVANNDAATQGEIDNALAAAHQMMMAHHLSEDDIVVKDDAGHETIRPEDLDLTIGHAMSSSSRLSQWEASLSMFVEKFVGSVKCWIEHGTAIHRQNGIAMRLPNGDVKRSKRVAYSGDACDVNLATNLFEELTLTIATSAELQYGGSKRGEGRSYAEGFVNGLHSGLKKSDAICRNTSQSTALMVRSEQVALIKKEATFDFLKEKGYKFVKRSRGNGGRHFSDAYAHGKTDGKGLNVGAKKTARLTNG